LVQKKKKLWLRGVGQKDILRKRLLGSAVRGGGIDAKQIGETIDEEEMRGDEKKNPSPEEG